MKRVQYQYQIGFLRSGAGNHAVAHTTHSNLNK